MSEWSDLFDANADALGHALAESTADFVCLATSHGEPFYLNPAGRRLVGLEENRPASAISLRELYAEDSWIELRDVAVPAVNKTGRWEGSSRMRNVQTGELIEVRYQVVSPQVERERAGPLAWPSSIAKSTIRGPQGVAGRGPGPKKGHPRIVPRSDHHDQPRGDHYGVQQGGRADLRPSAGKSLGHEALGRALSHLGQPRPAGPHRPLPRSRRRLVAGPAGRGRGRPGQRRRRSTPRWP